MMTAGSSELDVLFAAHTQMMRERYAAALAVAGFDAVLVHAGCPPIVFADDQHYPFRAHATFKSFVPLTDVADSWLYFKPGELPLLLFSSPTDFWYKSQPLPESY